MTKNITSLVAALAVLSALTACKNKTETAHVSAPAAMPSASTQSADQPSRASTDELSDDPNLVLNDKFVSPDENAEAVSDEEGATAEEIPADVVDPLENVDAPDAVQVKFVASTTTNLLIEQQQSAYAREIEKRNEDVRANHVKAAVAENASAKPANAPGSNEQSSPALRAELIDRGSLIASDPASEVSTKSAAPVDEKTILEDKQGQWAVTASASSTYAQSAAPKAGYSALQATGAPNVARYSDDPAAWTTKSGDSRDPEWLELGFAKPVNATSIRIRQSAAPGVISRIELIDESNITHTIWEGTDDTNYAKNAIGWLVKDFPRTTYRVKGARITLMTARVWGWNEIDAVQLVGE